ncbi:MAG: S8 family peptidase [bacterium]|nr:S8 family peptidase [bacterium]
MNQVREKLGCDLVGCMGFTGRGIGIAVLDTGVFLHRDFDSRIRAFEDMTSRRQLPYDDNGHGTHIAGIIAGNGYSARGRYTGIAPNSHLVVVKVLDKNGNGYVSDVLAGLSWVKKHREQYGIRIVNISVGSFSRRNMSENSALVKGVDAVWDEGLVVVVAAGNNGPKRQSITTPGISRKVITVGSSDDDREVEVGGVKMVDYSGRGPTGDCICKPDLVAPGSGIVSCANRQGKYSSKSGTSMSTPMVSAAAALLLEKYPRMSNRDVKLRFMERAVDLGLPHNQQGWGELQIRNLLR